MKKCFFICILLCAWSIKGQEQVKAPFSIDVDFTYGAILEHNPDISHLIIGHPRGFEITYNRKTYGKKQWERLYNFPDWGVSFVYQDLDNPVLGENYSLLAHYTWYFFNRNLNFKAATGISYVANPFNAESNPANNAYGTRILSTSYFKLNYVKEKLYKNIGFQAGIGLIHYSNGSLKSPNTSTNTIAFNLGFSYLVNSANIPDYQHTNKEEKKYTEPLRYNIAFKFGVNESDVIGLGQHAFYNVSGYIDKRFGYKHTVQAGVDVFFSNFLKNFIRYRSIAFPEDGLRGDEDHKRVGVFGGYQMHFNKTALAFNVGYYLYWPYEFETRIYNRFELKRFFMKDAFFASVSVKSHFAKAESLAFGIGARL